jgi:hypothetical protein
MKSILQTEKKCFVCGKTYDLAVHHVYEGTANRRVSDATGMTIFLCHYHHNMSDEGIHFNKELDLSVKRYAQEVYERTHSREEFRSLFGKSWL